MILFVSACKSKSKKNKQIENKPFKVENNVVIKNINFEDGDKLISNLDFIKSINNTCKRVRGVIDDNDIQRKDFNNRCKFYKISYNYNVFRGFEGQKQLFRKNNIRYSLGVANKNSDSDDYKFINLYSIKNGKKMDSLTIYSYQNYIEALVTKGTYFYIKNDKVFIYEFNEDEKGIHNNKWSEYKIEKDKFKLSKRNISF